MYVDMQVIGYALSSPGWNQVKKRAARYQIQGMSMWCLTYKPDMSVCTGSGGLLLTSLVVEDWEIGFGPRGVLALTFDAEARLQNGQFDVYDPNAGTANSTGLVTGTAAEVGAEIERRTGRRDLGKAANHTVNALVQGTYKCCKITSINSGKVLDVRGASTAEGAELQQWEYGGGANQLWRLVPVSPDSYALVSMNSNKVVDVPGSSKSDGAVMVQWGYKGSSNQHWRVIDIGRNDYKIESVDSGKVLDVPNGSTSDGTSVIQWGYKGGTNQRWRIDGMNIAGTPTPPPTSAPNPDPLALWRQSQRPQVG